MLTKNFLKRARKSGFWLTSYQFLRLQEKLCHIWCIISHCITFSNKFDLIWGSAPSKTTQNGTKMVTSMPPYLGKLFFANSIISLPHDFLYSFLLFLDTDTALQTICKVISLFPKTLRYWVCHFHCNNIEIKKNWKIILKQQLNYCLSNCLCSKLISKPFFVSSFTSNPL